MKTNTPNIKFANIKINKALFLILILILLISCETKKIEETTGPPIIEPGKMPEQKENVVKIKDKLTIVDEEGRALEIEIKEE